MNCRIGQYAVCHLKTKQHDCFFDACKCSLAGTRGLHSAFMAFCQQHVQCGCSHRQVKGVVQWLRASKTVLHRPDWETRREKRMIYYDKSPIQALPPYSAYRYVIHTCTRAYRDQAKYHVIPYISLPSQPPLSAQTRLHLTYNLVEPLPTLISSSSFSQVKAATLQETGGSTCNLMTSFFSAATITPITQNPVRQIHYLTWHWAHNSLAVLLATPRSAHKHTRACTYTHIHLHTLLPLLWSLSQSLQQAALWEHVPTHPLGGHFNLSKPKRRRQSCDTSTFQYDRKVFENNISAKQCNKIPHQ